MCSIPLLLKQWNQSLFLSLEYFYLLNNVSYLTYGGDTELQKPSLFSAVWEEPFCDLLLKMGLQNGILKSPYLALTFAQMIAKNIPCYWDTQP